MYDVIVTSWWRYHDRLCDRRQVQFISSEIYTKTIKIKIWLQQVYQNKILILGEPKFKGYLWPPNL